MSASGSSHPPTFRQASGRAMWAAVQRLLRTRIVAGILTVVPIWITWTIVKFVFNVMRDATQPLVNWATETAKGGLPNPPPEGLQHLVDFVREAERQHPNTVPPESLRSIVEFVDAQSRHYADSPVPQYMQVTLDWLAPVLAVLLTLFLLYLLGLLTANVFGRRIIAALELLVDRVPIVKTVYRSTKQIVMTLSGQTNVQAGRVVLVEFPRPGMKCLGFMTSIVHDKDTGRELCTVFIPTTPNPTTGYMQIMPSEQVSETDWTVEDAAKIMMSGGVLCPEHVPFDKITPVKPIEPVPEGRKEELERAFGEVKSNE